MEQAQHAQRGSEQGSFEEWFAAGKAQAQQVEQEEQEQQGQQGTGGAKPKAEAAAAPQQVGGERGGCAGLQVPAGGVAADCSHAA